jgi:hypothetical protein
VFRVIEEEPGVEVVSERFNQGIMEAPLPKTVIETGLRPEAS